MFNENYLNLYIYVPWLNFLIYFKCIRQKEKISQIFVVVLNHFLQFGSKSYYYRVHSDN